MRSGFNMGGAADLVGKKQETLDIVLIPNTLT
jgi:hypothetical protein